MLTMRGKLRRGKNSVSPDWGWGGVTLVSDLSQTKKKEIPSLKVSEVSNN